LKGLIAQYQGHDAQAENFYKKVPTSAPAHYNLGVLYDREGKPDKAIVEFKAAISLDPVPQAHIHLGNIYYEQHHPELAIDEYREALLLYKKVASTSRWHFFTLIKPTGMRGQSRSKERVKSLWRKVREPPIIPSPLPA
jgi:protein O-GlcNAc transferase